MQKDRFTISTDKNLLDLDVIYGFISTSYWANGIPRSVVEKSVQNSLCFGLYDDMKQIGFARAVTDFATFAYMADVFIIKEYQGQGLGKLLVDYIVNYPEFKNLRRFMLATRDAHSLYEKFGFKPLNNPQNYMSIHKPDIYKCEENR